MRNRYILLLDLPLIAVAAFGAFALRFDWVFLTYRREFPWFLIAALLIKPTVLYMFGMYGRYWRYATATDLVAVTIASIAASVAMAVYVGLGTAFHTTGDFSRAVLPIDWLLTLALIGGMRMSVRIIGEAQQKAQRAATAGTLKRVLVIGAGEAGAMVVRELQRNPQLGIMPVGFLDDAPAKLGKWIGGVRVLGTIDTLVAVARERRADQVIIALPAAGGTVVRRVAALCRAARIESRTVPGVFELLGGRISVNQLRTVEISDLLRRQHLTVPAGDRIAQYVHRATVMVTGAGGSIGQELCRQAALAGPSRLLLVGHGENSIFELQYLLHQQSPTIDVVPIIADVRDKHRLRTVFEQYRPEVVLHAAAHKHVPLMERNSVEALTNNVLGTYYVASLAREFGARRFVLISTDKAVAPRSVMGASKRLAELVVKAFPQNPTTFVTVRFGNVLGSRGSVVPLFKAQIEHGGPLTLTHPDMKRFFMTIPEAVNLVLRAGGLDGGLFVLNMGQPIRIHELAKDLIQLSGFSLAEIPIVFTGIRPGEKLDEALWEDGATAQPTDEPDILRVIESVSQSEMDLAALLQRLDAAVLNGSRMAVEAFLADHLENFVPTITGDDAPAVL